MKRFQPDEWAEIDDLPAEVYMDVLVRAGIEAGWFGDSLTIEQLDDMMPKDVDQIAIAVAEVYRNVKTPDPN
ncbi:MAG: hypothetical protein GWN94_22590 [Phycisphaerae bacterium]|nr:hypothetical protein [Phycisphaerae bacterium]NIS53851.1 hypothetical protein [Phycisphaerae bacterium]